MPRREIALAVVWREPEPGKGAAGSPGTELLVARRQGEHLRGTWEFPGGKIEPGETVGEAAERECREELGLEVRAVGELGTVEWDYEEFVVVLRIVRCEVAENEPSDQKGTVIGSANEKFETAWMTAAALRREAIPPANFAVLDAIEAAWPAARESG